MILCCIALKNYDPLKKMCRKKGSQLTLWVNTTSYLLTSLTSLALLNFQLHFTLHERLNDKPANTQEMIRSNHRFKLGSKYFKAESYKSCPQYILTFSPVDVMIIVYCSSLEKWRLHFSRKCVLKELGYWKGSQKRSPHVMTTL